jgi:hypothetical protein
MASLNNRVRSQQAALSLQQNKTAVVKLPPPPPPEPTTPLPAPPIILQGELKEGQDLGVIKVEEGELIIDMSDFDPDFGTF